MVRKQIEKLLSDAIKKLGIDGQASVSFSSLPELCDYQSNSAFVLAKQNLAVRWAVLYTMIVFIIIFGAYGFGYTAVDPLYAQF